MFVMPSLNSGGCCSMPIGGCCGDNTTLVEELLIKESTSAYNLYLMAAAAECAPTFDATMLDLVATPSLAAACALLATVSPPPSTVAAVSPLTSPLLSPALTVDSSGASSGASSPSAGSSSTVPGDGGVFDETRPHQCFTCGKRFRFKSNLFEHKSLHQLSTPFVCPFCGKTCRLKGNLKKHLQTHVGAEALEVLWKTKFSRSAGRPRKNTLLKPLPSTPAALFSSSDLIPAFPRHMTASTF